MTKKYTQSQRRKLRLILRFYRERNSYNEVTSVRLKIPKEPRYSFISVSVTTRRSDCSPNSPRAILCEQTAHFMVTKRGGVTVTEARNGFKDETIHVAKVLGFRTLLT